MTKISQLPAGSSPVGNERIPAVQGGATVYLTPAQLALLARGTTASKAADFTADPTVGTYYVDTTAAVTVHLNATPTAGEGFDLWDNTGHAGTNPITFDGNGHNIAGVGSVPAQININFGHARVSFDGTQWLMQ